jgi:hypothetical protein
VLRRILNLTGRKEQEAGENCTMRSFIIGKVYPYRKINKKWCEHL